MTQGRHVAQQQKQLGTKHTAASHSRPQNSKQQQQQQHSSESSGRRREIGRRNRRPPCTAAAATARYSSKSNQQTGKAVNSTNTTHSTHSKPAEAHKQQKTKTKLPNCTHARGSTKAMTKHDLIGKRPTT